MGFELMFMIDEIPRLKKTRLILCQAGACSMERLFVGIGVRRLSVPCSFGITPQGLDGSKRQVGRSSNIHSIRYRYVA